MMEKIILKWQDGRLKAISNCPVCGGRLTVHALPLGSGVPEYISVTCVTASSLHTEAGLSWSRVLRRYTDTGIPYSIT